jgi:hypothetical protein
LWCRLQNKTPRQLRLLANLLLSGADSVVCAKPYTAAGLRVASGTSSADAGLQPPEYYRYSWLYSRRRCAYMLGSFALMCLLHGKWNRYKLVGVLIHSGTAEAGHYYSYVKRRGYDTRPVETDEAAESSKEGGGSFFTFDDTRVEGHDLCAYATAPLRFR